MQVVHQSFPRKVCAKHMFECGSGFSFLSEPNQVQESRNRSWTELDKPSVLFCHAGMHSVNDYVETIKNIYLYFFFISVVTHIPIKNCSFIQSVTTTTEPGPVNGSNKYSPSLRGHLTMNLPSTEAKVKDWCIACMHFKMIHCSFFYYCITVSL